MRLIGQLGKQTLGSRQAVYEKPGLVLNIYLVFKIGLEGAEERIGPVCC